MKAYQDFIDEMSKSDKREIKSRLYIVMEHVLKLKYIKDQIATDNAWGWGNSTHRERRALADLFSGHPGLKPKLTDRMVDEVYRAAVADVQVVYPDVRFPKTRQLPLEEIVGEEVMAALGR